MTPQMKQIDGTEISGNGHQSETARRFRKDHRSAHVDAIQNKPDIGCSISNRTAVGCGDDMLPAAQVVGSANALDSALIRDATLIEAHRMNADAIELIDRLSHGCIRVGNGAGSHAEESAIQGEVLLHRGEGA